MDGLQLYARTVTAQLLEELVVQRHLRFFLGLSMAGDPQAVLSPRLSPRAIDCLPNHQFQTVGCGTVRYGTCTVGIMSRLKCLLVHNYKIRMAYNHTVAL